MGELESLEAYRSYLFAIAYRMLGSVSDAEDMVQECFLRHETRGGDAVITSLRSYLATSVTRLCMEQLRKAYVRRETYVGPWLPEPLLTTPGDGDGVAVDVRHGQLEDVSMAFLLLLEQLSPVERAAYLLRKAFDYDYGEIAVIVEKSEANCRQLVRRAQARIDGRPPRYDASPEEQMQLVSAFLMSCGSGDMAGLLSLLAKDVAFTSDSDGKAKAARRTVLGADKVARFLVALARKTPAHFVMEPAELNGAPGLLLFDAGSPQSATVLELQDGKISAFYVTVNPEKLQHLQQGGGGSSLGVAMSAEHRG